MPDQADIKVVGKAFRVEVNGQFLPIKSYDGGDPIAEKAEASTGSSQYNECTMGHNSMSELTLVAYITPNQKILADAAHMVANEGKNERFTITIQELAKDKSPVKTFNYYDCLLTSLDFPTCSAQGGEYLCQTATFKPEHFEVT
jgi:hypothetical protein